MKWELSVFLTLGSVLATALGAAEPSPTIIAVIYNYAAIPFGVLAQSEAEAARILHNAGVHIQWVDCPLSQRDADGRPACQIKPGPTRLALRIQSQTMAKRLHQVKGSFGFAQLPEDGSFGTVVNVFAHDAEQLANRGAMRRGVILGHVIAHEVGHLLLGAGSHSISGIMNDNWRPKELATIAQGRMLFTPSEAAGMRTNIRVRMAAEAAAGGGLVPR